MWMFIVVILTPIQDPRFDIAISNLLIQETPDKLVKGQEPISARSRLQTVSVERIIE